MKISMRTSRTGSAIVMVMFIMVILLAMGTAMLSLGTHVRLAAVRASSVIAARTAADAGLTKALFEMNEKLKVTPWDDSVLPQATNETLPGCNATFSYTVTGDSGSGFTIESTGKSGDWAERKVNTTLRLRGPFDYAVLVQGSLILMKDTLVDGYNSSDPTDTDVELKIATTSDVPWHMITAGATVDGEILTGIEGDFPLVTPPEFTGPDTPINIQKTSLTIGPADSGRYTGITLKTGAVLAIDGGDVVLHVTGDINIGKGCEIAIKPNSSLTLYLDGNLVAGNSNGINNETMIPSNFALYGTGQNQTFDLKAGSAFYGAIYAPNAKIDVFGGVDIYGSFISSSFWTKSGSNIYYDVALRDNVSMSGVGSHFVVKRWQEQ